MRLQYIAGLTIQIDDKGKVIRLADNQLDDDELLNKIPVVMNEIKALIQEGYSLRFV